jgi:hypothetical protein
MTRVRSVDGIYLSHDRVAGRLVTVIVVELADGAEPMHHKKPSAIMIISAISLDIGSTAMPRRDNARINLCASMFIFISIPTVGSLIVRISVSETNHLAIDTFCW